LPDVEAAVARQVWKNCSIFSAVLKVLRRFLPANTQNDSLVHFGWPIAMHRTPNAPDLLKIRRE
jgi:hypothetical protein